MSEQHYPNCPGYYFTRTERVHAANGIEVREIRCGGCGAVLQTFTLDYQGKIREPHVEAEQEEAVLLAINSPTASSADLLEACRAALRLIEHCATRRYDDTAYELAEWLDGPNGRALRQAADKAEGTDHGKAI